MKVTLISVLLLLCHISGLGQNTTVTGIVKDEANNVVPFAHVIFTETTPSQKQHRCLTNELGVFEIEIPKQLFNFEVSFVGSKSSKIEVDLRKSQDWEDMGEIAIELSSMLEEVIVSTNTSAYQIELDKKVYVVSNDIANNGGNLIDVLENVPSVQVEIDGNISIRGTGNVRILIDGKISGLTNTTSLFKTIPASSIERIEVITNPSSKYSSNGDGGIINVILKKDKKKMLSSSIEGFSGIRINSGVNFNISQSNDKFAWYLNSGLGYSEPKMTYSVHLQNDTATPTEYLQDSETLLSQFYFINNIGGELSLNAKHAITADITYRLANLNNVNSIQYQDFDENLLSNTSTRVDHEEDKDNFLQASSEYSLKLNERGSQLKISGLLQLSVENGDSRILEQNIIPVSTLIANDFIRNDATDNRYTFALDYVTTLKDSSQFELGCRNRNINVKNDYSVERTINNISSPVPEFTDNTNYQENVTAFYSQYAKSLKKLKIQIGLRAEITHLNLYSNYGMEVTKRRYANLFPSFFLDYELQPKQRLKLSFSRRIQRPWRNAIMSFNSFSDSRNIFAGNPEINPSYAILAEIGYQRDVNNRFAITPSVFYKNRTDVMDFYVQNENITFSGIPQNVFVTRMVNIGNSNALGIEINTSYKPLKWLKIFNELTIAYFQQKGNFNDFDYNSEGIFGFGRLNLNFLLSKSIKFQMQHRFSKGQRRGQIERKSIYRMDLGLNFSLFKGHASLTFNMKDVFDSWESRIIQQGQGFTQTINKQIRTPQFNASFIYRFNQNKYRGKKGRQYDRL